MAYVLGTGRTRAPFRNRAVLAATLVGVVLTGRGVAQNPNARPFAEGEVLVKFRSGVDGNGRAAAHRSAVAALLAENRRTGVQRVRVRPGDESAAVARYLRNPNVAFAEPNLVRRIPDVVSHGAGSSALPADHNFAQQWGLHNTGQSFYCLPWITGQLCLYTATADADIDAPEAWAVSRGSSAVTVAVIDSGIDYTHPDLSPNYAGGDDFVSTDGDPMDDHGHGTHVAGIIAAAVDNLTGTPGAAEGVAGVAPRARIRAYKACSADGSCTDFAIEQAIARAIDDGASVINMSLGSLEYSQSLDEAVQDAWNAGLVVVAGAGNNNTTAPFYPAALPNVVAVAAFDEDGRRASFSNHGAWVDLSAPGNVVVSTYPMSACAGAATPPGDTGCYAWLSGTSMAAPHVAGAAALIWSRGDVSSNAQVVNILLSSADGKGVSTTRLDAWTAHGGVNLHDAISFGLTNLPPVADAGPDQTVPDTNGDGTELVTLDGRASTDRDGSITSYVWREGAASIAVGATSSVWLSVGVHTLTLEVTDDDGETATDSVVVTVEAANRVTVIASVTQAAEAGPASGEFTISRTGGTSVPLTVRYTLSGTAVAGSDYVALPGVATIAAGASTSVVAVMPIDDAVYEGNETVGLGIAVDAGYTVGSPRDATVTIVSDDLPPDLVVTAMTVPAAGGADTDIVVTDTTANQGTGAAPPSRTGFYLSANAALDAPDVLLGSRSIPALAAAASHQQSTTVHIPAGTAPGTYYVFAKADFDGALPEKVETNNVKSSGALRIGPDLVVSAVGTPSSAVAGQSFIVNDSTKNQGAGHALVSSTGFYLSANLVVDAGDLFLGSRAAGALDAGATGSGSVSLQLPSSVAPGSYYVVARADWNNGVAEVAESNNERASSAVKIGGDLVLTALTASATAGAGGPMTVTDTTTNTGAAPVQGSITGFYLSLDFAFSASADVPLGSRPVPSLQPAGASTASIQVTVPQGTAPGTYYVIGAADAGGAVGESVENNNTRNSGAVRVGPDLVVTSLIGPSSAVSGTSFTASDTAMNQGGDAAAGSVTRFYLSSNTALDAGDLLLGSRTVPPLAPGQGHAGSALLVVPAGTSPGTYVVIAVADGGSAVAEAVENNNTRVKTMTVSAAP